MLLLYELALCRNAVCDLDFTVPGGHQQGRGRYKLFTLATLSHVWTRYVLNATVSFVAWISTPYRGRKQSGWHRPSQLTVKTVLHVTTVHVSTIQSDSLTCSLIMLCL